MRAIQVQANGGPEVLTVAELDPPVPGPGQVVIDVAATGVNFIEIYQREGIYPRPLPFVPGSEAAGVVSAVGPDVADVAVGDRVAAVGVLGAYAEQTVAPAEVVVAVPDDVDLETAAAVMLQGMTAHYLVTDSFHLRPGHRCLIHAGAGGVGLLAIQMAVAAGAEVYTTVSSTEKAALAAGAGAHHVIRYDEEPFDGAARRLAREDRPFDVVFDGVGASTFHQGLGLLRRRGTMVLFGQASGPVPPFDLQELNRNGSLFVTRPSLGHHTATRSELLARSGAVLGRVADGSLSVRVGARYPLADAAEAHRALAARQTTGKVLLVP